MTKRKIGRTILRNCRKSPDSPMELYESRISREWEFMGHAFATMRPRGFEGELKKGWVVVHIPSGLCVDSLSLPTRDQAEAAAQRKLTNIGQERVDKTIAKAAVVNKGEEKGGTPL